MYDVLRFAAGAVGEALDTAADLAVARGMPRPEVGLSDDEVVAAFESERRLRAPPGDRPASGVRGLDFTRVIAGPVGSRYLGALGADVLRIDPPAMPELPLQVADGVVGKRLVERDLRADPLRADELDAFEVVVPGYRPGALAAFGLDGDALAERHPHLTVIQLSAWGTNGMWGTRRGFDSLVQAATGIA